MPDENYADKENCDVLVCGSGPAGLGAAVSAARLGAGVMLLEAAGLPGGTINAVPWMPVNRLLIDGRERSYAHARLVGHIRKYGDAATRPGRVNKIDGDGLSNHVEYSELAIYDMLEEAGVRYRMYSPVVDAMMDGSRVIGAVAREKRGPVAYSAKVVVDATGDGDVAAAAGCEYMAGREDDGIHMPITLGFSLGGIDKEAFVPWMESERDGKFKEIAEDAEKKGYYVAAWYSVNPGTLPGIVGVNNGAWKEQSLKSDGLSAADLTAARRNGIHVAVDMARMLRDYHVPGAEGCFLDKTGNILGVRDTRRIVGEYVQTFEDSQDPPELDDAVARKYGYIDGNQVYIGPMKSGFPFPYRALLPKRIDGLLVAGRCASMTFLGHCAGKSMGNMMELGGAAGAASGGEAAEPSTGDNAGEAVGEEPLQITGLAISYGSTPDQVPELWDAYEKFFNIDYEVDWAPDGDAYGQKLQLRLSSGSIPDLVQVRDLSEAAVAQALKAGLFAELTGYLGDFSEYPNLGSLNPTGWKLSKVDGTKIYLIPRTRGQYNMPITIIREDWLKEVGMETPETTVELADYFKAVKAKYPDVIPCPVPLSWERIGPCFGPGAIEPVYDAEGGLIHPYFCDSYTTYLEYWRDLYAADCIAKEYSLLSSSQHEEMFMTGQTASAERNIYHYKRLETEINKRAPGTDAVAAPVLSLTGPDGRYGFDYDKGFWGGLVISAKIPDEKIARILEFLNKSAAPENFNFITWGLEGIHWNLVDGEAQLTDLGQKEVNASNYSPFIQATDTYQKVNSPYASPEQNAFYREYVKLIDVCATKYANSPLNIFKVIVSDIWAKQWARIQDEYNEMQVDVITGNRSLEDFQAYIEEVRETPEMKEAFQDLKAAADTLGFPQENPPVFD
jgi:putative aldouronate transport system substrate-binding protein